VLRLTSLLWRLRRATAVETGLFEIQADHLAELKGERHLAVESRQIFCAMNNPLLSLAIDQTEMPPCCEPTSAGAKVVPSVDLARCFLRLANLPNFALDRLGRYETALWRQVGQTLFALDALNRREPKERGRSFGRWSTNLRGMSSAIPIPSAETMGSATGADD
jgi:hypothetical protein